VWNDLFTGVKTGKIKRIAARIFSASLLLWPECLVFSKDRGDGLCGNGAFNEGNKAPRIVNVGKLGTDDEAKAEAGDDNQDVT
jgi:hypothetical protein